MSDPETSADRVVRLHPVGSSSIHDLAKPLPGIKHVIGPVYSTRALMNVLGLSRSTVSKKVKEGRILAIKVQGRNLFPVFQFNDHQVRSDVLKVVDELRECADPFTIALWLQTPMADDSQVRTPLAALYAGRHRVALHAARRAAARWSE